ncbi:MAG: hypothetical protein Q8M99_03335 [Methylotenera sp.]|nr:hypothetical protein [Methylotenera sp.]
MRFEVKIRENEIVEIDVMMTREDILQELELLPLWQLREGLPSLKMPPLAPTTLNISETFPVVKVNMNESNIIEKRETLDSLIFTHVASEDGNWLFVLANAILQADEVQLIQNICKAMRIKAKPSILTVNTLDFIQSAQPKMIVAMGESTAQAMLQSAESLVDLSGKLHQFQGVALVTTYDLAHLLNNLSDKAKAWNDLRFAMQALRDIQL